MEVDVGWVPADVCRLPTADQPARLAEFDELFRTSLVEVRRPEAGWLRLRLRGDVTDRARELTDREARCCGFFDFTVGRDGADVLVDVRVPAGKVVVLDGIEEQARSVSDADE